MARRAHWLAQDDAQGLVEYALILALTSLGMVLAVLLLRDSLGSPVRGSSNALDGITAEAPADADPGRAGGRAARPGNPRRCRRLHRPERRHRQGQPRPRRRQRRGRRGLGNTPPKPLSRAIRGDPPRTARAVAHPQHFVVFATPHQITV